MKALALLLIGLLSGGALSAQESVRQIAWSGSSAPVAAGAGTVVEVDGRAALRVQNTNATPLLVRLLDLDRPLTELRAYTLRGEVRYDAVQGDGFLEMWSEFPPARAGQAPGRYFSRTLGLSGPMEKITGTSGWRAFELPFDPTGASGAPTRLEMNLHLPGKGTVFLGPITLMQYPGTRLGAVGPDTTGAWWSNRQGGILGGIAGSVLGCFGALLGTLASRGRAPRFIEAAMRGLIVLGVFSLVIAVVALARSQPFHVTALPGLLGLILVTSTPFQLRQYRRQRAALELRRMSAADAV